MDNEKPITKYHYIKDEKTLFCINDSPSNQEESDAYASILAKGNYPQGLDGCFTVGISGGCGFNCFVLQSGDCKLIDEFIEVATKEQLEYLYDNGFYEDELRERMK